jgi:opacity protein-like surface antigen
MSLMRAVIAGALVGIAGFPSVQAAAVPEQPGWSGFVQLGYSYNGVENNEVAGTGIGGYTEFTPESIDRLCVLRNTDQGLGRPLCAGAEAQQDGP